MRKDITITAEERETRGKNEARRLRVRGLIPSVVYGMGGTPVSVVISPKEINRILHSDTGHNTIFNLDVKGGETTPVMIVDWVHDPVKENLLHIDMKRIDLGKRITVKVPVHAHGDAKGVKLQGGLLETITREVEIECLPDDIPLQFDVNVAELMVGQSIRVSDIVLSGSMKLISPPEAVVAHVITLKAEEEVAPAAVEVAVAGTEPEVIKKGKKEDDDAAPAAGDKKAGGDKKAAPADDKKKKKK